MYENLTLSDWRVSLAKEVCVFVDGDSYLCRRIDEIAYTSVSNPRQILTDNLYLLLRFKYFKNASDDTEKKIADIVNSFLANYRSSIKRNCLEKLPIWCIAFKNGVYDFKNNDWLFTYKKTPIPFLGCNLIEYGDYRIEKYFNFNFVETICYNSLPENEKNKIIKYCSEGDVFKWELYNAFSQKVASGIDFGLTDETLFVVYLNGLRLGTKDFTEDFFVRCDTLKEKLHSLTADDFIHFFQQADNSVLEMMFFDMNKRRIFRSKTVAFFGELADDLTRLFQGDYFKTHDVFLSLKCLKMVLCVEGDISTELKKICHIDRFTRVTNNVSVVKMSIIKGKAVFKR